MRCCSNKYKVDRCLVSWRADWCQWVCTYTKRNLGEGEEQFPGYLLAIPLMATTPDLLTRLRAMVRGRVLFPSDAAYDFARRVYNGLIDRRPAVIVQCAGTEDVQTVVRFCTDHHWLPAVRGGGHSAAGYSVCEGGLVIDLSLMKAAQVDPVRRIARVQPGVTWGELDSVTQSFGLATTGARISSAGVVGVTLGGGYGWLMRKHGLAIDNLVSAEIVTANGNLLRVSTSHNPDLFWGIRGGGGNFGVVVSLELQLHPLTQVTGGMVFYPASRLREVLSLYGDFMMSAPDDLSALCNFLIMPAAPFVPPHLQGIPVVAIAVCHAGSQDAAQHDLQPLRELGPPLIDRIRPMTYSKLQRMYDAAGTFGHKTYSRSGHLPSLSSTARDAIAVHASRIMSPLSIVMLCRLGGAVARVGEHDTAFAHRDTAFDLAINAVWSDADELSFHKSWTDEFWAVMQQFCAGVYVNELGQEGDERVRDAYPPETYRRLAALKTLYDPENLFRFNHNIAPAG
jgi:FAD/FMN-containing dehydrogenase